MFLGATAGIGKFTLSIFSIYKQMASNSKTVILLPTQESIKARFDILHKIFGNKVGFHTNNTTKDMEVLTNFDIILTSPESWDVISRRWKIRKGFENIGLFIVVDIHLIGEVGSTLEVLISRMRYISSQRSIPIRIIALGCSVANYKDIAGWIGC